MTSLWKIKNLHKGDLFSRFKKSKKTKQGKNGENNGHILNNMNTYLGLVGVNII
jgi:hypothetical protein